VRVAALLALFVATSAVAGEWDKLPPLPDKEGFAGPFAGVSGGVLVVAGGANFPDKKPWDGGKKQWYDTAFVLEKPDGKWRVAGKLPRPLGYGVGVTHGPCVVCVGGSDADRHYTDVFRLEWKDGKLLTSKLPSLPKPLANGCGALVGDVLYLAGGQEKPDSSPMKSAWMMDLSAKPPNWTAIDDCPGAGRMLATAASFGGSFWLVGGVDLVLGKGGKVERNYLTDAYRFTPGKGWMRVADLPHAVAAAPTPAPVSATGFTLLGGDDGSQLGTAPAKHPGFNKRLLHYNAKADKWAAAGEWSAPRVTVPCVPWRGAWVVPGGEARPGVRSPDIWRFTPTR